MTEANLREAYQLWLGTGEGTETAVPEFETLKRYQAGELSPEERESVTRALCRDPRLARLLIAPLSPPEEGEMLVPPAELVSKSWEEFQARFIAEEPNVDRAVAQDSAKPSGTVEPFPSKELRRTHGGRRKAFSLAASLAVVVMGALLAHQHRVTNHLELAARQPQVVSSQAVLAPDGVRGRGFVETATLQVKARHPSLLVTDLLGVPELDLYDLELFRLDGDEERPSWEVGGLQPGPNRTLDIWVPAEYLRPGGYRFDLYGDEGNGRRLLASYTFRSR